MHRRAPSPTRLALTLASLGACLAACPQPVDPGLAPGGEFERDPTCTLTGTLTVEIGEGSGGFTPLAANASPEVHYGSQGAQHIFVGVRVSGLALDRYDTLRTLLTWYPASECPTLGEPCEGEYYGYNEWVLGDVAPLEIVDDDTIEQGDLRLVLEGGGDIIVQAEVEDPCGRRGLAQLPMSQ